MDRFTKRCVTCMRDRPHGDFGIRPDNMRLMSSCKPCRAAETGRWIRDNRRKANDSRNTSRRTLNGWMQRTYSHMLERTRGQKNNGKYLGLPIMPRRSFYLWAARHIGGLYERWVRSGFAPGERPVVNRLRTGLFWGYTADNIRLITRDESSRLGGFKRWDK